MRVNPDQRLLLSSLIIHFIIFSTIGNAIVFHAGDDFFNPIEDDTVLRIHRSSAAGK
jgi:hypothetical protein